MGSTLEPEEMDIQVLDVLRASENVSKASLQDLNSQNLKKRELVKASYVMKGEVGLEKGPRGIPPIMPLCFMAGLVVIWLFVGLVVFLKTGNLDLLKSASGTLVVLVLSMVHHFLPQPKS